MSVWPTVKITSLVQNFIAYRAAHMQDLVRSSYYFPVIVVKRATANSSLTSKQSMLTYFFTAIVDETMYSQVYFVYFSSFPITRILFDLLYLHYCTDVPHPLWPHPPAV